MRYETATVQLQIPERGTLMRIHGLGECQVRDYNPETNTLEVCSVDVINGENVWFVEPVTTWGNPCLRAPVNR